MRKIVVAALFGGWAVACPGQTLVRAEVLITVEEAKLPASTNASLPMRGVTRGPGIEQESPPPNFGVRSPVPFKIRFETRNHVAIDTATVRLLYLKATPVNLTERVRKYITEDGIVMNEAEAPPGVHLLRLDIKDKQGRGSTAIIKLTVTDK